jgi:hypothetical protein
MSNWSTALICTRHTSGLRQEQMPSAVAGLTIEAGLIGRLEILQHLERMVRADVEAFRACERSLLEKAVRSKAVAAARPLPLASRRASRKGRCPSVSRNRSYSPGCDESATIASERHRLKTTNRGMVSCREGAIDGRVLAHCKKKIF